MRKFARALLLLGALASLSALVGAQACPDCKDVAKVACRRHAPLWRAGSFCSERAKCGACARVGRAACARCLQNLRDWAAKRMEDLLARSWHPGQLRATMFFDAERVRFGLGPQRSAGSPQRRHKQIVKLVEHVVATRAAFLRELGFTESDFPKVDSGRTAAVGGAKTQLLASADLDLLVLGNRRDLRRVTPGLTGFVHQGLATLRFGGRSALVLHNDRGAFRDDLALQRGLTFGTVRLLLANVVRPLPVGSRGLGWLASGLAHHYEAQAPGGRCENVSYQGHLQTQWSYYRGDWAHAARELHSEKRLPALGSGFGKNASDLTPEERVLSFAFVRYLMQRQDGGKRLGQVIRRVKNGASAPRALAAVFGGLAALERKFFATLGSGPQPIVIRPEPHIALYIYTRPHFRPRHEAVIRKAIAKRAAVHTSGWRIAKNRPVHELGPVGGNVRHWRKGRITNTVGATWPFAAVVEFDKTVRDRDRPPAAYIDWFRRARDSRDPGAWRLDPAGAITYVPHINAETVGMMDDRFGYMAVVDTPTGDVIGSNEFAVRARVEWGDGRVSRRGWWVRFRTSKRTDARDWEELRTPLVPWRFARKTKKNGFVWSAGVEDPARELGVFGTGRVFRFPEIPVGMVPYRAR